MWPLYLLFAVLSTVSSLSSSSVAFAPLGGNASITCQCSRDQGCYDEHVRWVRISHNGSLQIIDTKCKTSNCRFTSKRLNDRLVELTVKQLEAEDSGRYYCGEHLSAYLQFTDNGTVLQVGDVWTNSGQVLMLTEWMDNDGKPELDWSLPPNGVGAELRCVVTGLSAPWVTVYWWSSRSVRGEVGHTWSSTETGGRYRVTSHLRVRIMHWENEYEHESQDLNLDKMVEVDEEFWCVVQVGVDNFVKSANVSFHPESKTDGCSAGLYAVMTVCAVCVCLLTLLTCHYLLHQLKGPSQPAAEASPLPESQADVYTGLTYAHLDFKNPSKAERRHRKADKPGRQVDNQADKLVYSEVRYQ